MPSKTVAPSLQPAHGLSSSSWVLPALASNKFISGNAFSSFLPGRNLSSAAASQAPTSQEEGSAPQPVPSCFAIVEILGKQYKVVEGDRVVTECLIGKIPGDEVTFDKVLMLGSKETTLLGRPYLENASVRKEHEKDEGVQGVGYFFPGCGDQRVMSSSVPQGTEQDMMSGFLGEEDELAISCEAAGQEINPSFYCCHFIAACGAKVQNSLP
eukprot:755208-Hanusia_phi.AAC.6